MLDGGYWIGEDLAPIWYLASIEKVNKMVRLSLRLLIGSVGLITVIILVEARQNAQADVANALDFQDQTVYYPEAVEFRYKHVWSPNGTFNTTPLSQVSDVRTAVTDHNGVATFALTELESIRDIHDSHRVQANFVPQAGENLATCLSPAFEAYTLTTKRRTPHSYPLYFAENSLFISAPTAEQFPELVDLLNRFKSSGNFTSCAEDATMDNWADAMGGRKRAQEIVDFLVANHMLTETADGKYRWYRSVHCGGHVIEHVRVDDVPDYTN